MTKFSLIADILLVVILSLGVIFAVKDEILKKRTRQEVIFQGMRAIGRTDKHGRPVYEGDIIRDEIFLDDENIIEISEIVWDDEVCGFLCRALQNGARFDIPSQEDFSKEIEVIANRWDPIETWGIQDGENN